MDIDEVLNEVDTIQKFNYTLASGEVFDTIRKSLIKDKKRKPIRVTNLMTKDKHLCCPTCSWVFPENLIESKTRCWKCGQSLDWKEE